MYEIVNPKHVFGIKMTVLSIVINKVRVYVRFLYFKSALAVFTMNGKINKRYFKFRYKNHD